MLNKQVLRIEKPLGYMRNKQVLRIEKPLGYMLNKQVLRIEKPLGYMLNKQVLRVKKPTNQALKTQVHELNTPFLLTTFTPSTTQTVLNHDQNTYPARHIPSPWRGLGRLLLFGFWARFFGVRFVVLCQILSLLFSHLRPFAF